jgi:deoxyribodipyrimidine photo-lyase
MSVPPARCRALNDVPPRADGAYVLYWMTAARRVRANFGLERAVEYATTMRKPLVVLEALRCDYPWASDRLHRFVLQGMADNRSALEGSGVSYYAYVEPEPGAGRGLLVRPAVVVVTDDYPEFFLPRMTRAVAGRVAVRLEQVDSNGLLPMRVADRVFPTAHAFRRFLQRELPRHLEEAPAPDPLRGVELPRPAGLPREISRRWPEATVAQLAGRALCELPIDHGVAPAPFDGGARAARAALRRFLDERLATYLDERNEPSADATSGLSPYLHFGQIASHEIFAELARREAWFPGRLARWTSGAREGWWGMSRPAEAFLDQLVTWREIGFNMAALADDPRSWDSLPAWARQTLDAHAGDERVHCYSREAFASAATHDALWNAAQRQLVREGRMHNYLRMLWGKKILEWSPTPREALQTMIALNDRYAVDGRDPNSYSGIFWCLGRYDRAWGPERPVFGTVRYMSSENTARKLRVKDFLRRYAEAPEPARRRP